MVASAIQAARSAGWQVPVWAGPTGEDPLVRQRLAAHRDWLDGVGFVSFRITSEVGPEPFATYRSTYEKRYGPDLVGVTENGRKVVQPPDWSMYSYDAVRLVAAGLAKSGAVGPPLLHALEGGVVITGANGDERGYLATTREGVSPDDMYFAVFRGFVFVPGDRRPALAEPAVRAPAGRFLMCGRYAAARSVDDIAAAFGIGAADVDSVAAPDWNVAPTKPVTAIAVVDGRRVATTFRWGLVPSWADGPAIGSRLINARMETAADKPAFRDALAARRCLLPADGWFEWQVRPDGSRQPYLLAPPDGALLAFAGLWESWTDASGRPLRTVTIVTGPAPPDLSHVHGRAPVVVPAADWDGWLDPRRRDGAGMLRATGPGIVVPRAVSDAVGDVRANGPRLVEPVPVAEQPPLF